MAKFQHVRHLRHRSLDGRTRGSGARKRLRHLDAYIERLASDYNGTETAQSVTPANATNDFTLAAHGLGIGWIVQLGGTAPTGLTAATDYFVIPTGANTFQLAASLAEAYDGIALTFSDDGATVTVSRQPSEDAMIAFLRSGVASEQLESGTDIDDVV